jgi:hypothetical protein
MELGTPHRGDYASAVVVSTPADFCIIIVVGLQHGGQWLERLERNRRRLLMVHALNVIRKIMNLSKEGGEKDVYGFLLVVYRRFKRKGSGKACCFLFASLLLLEEQHSDHNIMNDIFITSFS